MWQSLNRRVATAFESPIFWGSIATIGFYWAISVGAASGGPLDGGLIERYFASHWAEYLETSMFFVGGSALLLRWLDVRLGCGRTLRRRFRFFEVVIVVVA